MRVMEKKMLYKPAKRPLLKYENQNVLIFNTTRMRPYTLGETSVQVKFARLFG